MTLEQWEQNHWLSKSVPTQSEIVQLLAVVDREISDASVVGLFTLGAAYQHLSDQIELASRRRGLAMYDRVGVVEKVDADELLQTAFDLRAAVIVWLATNNPALLPKGFC